VPGLASTTAAGPARRITPAQWQAAEAGLAVVTGRILSLLPAERRGGLRQATERQMSKSPPRRFPVTVTQLPVTRCQICHRTVAYRPGNLTEVLTEHYRRTHPEALDPESR
jgi:hypothetical protein